MDMAALNTPVHCWDIAFSGRLLESAKLPYLLFIELHGVFSPMFANALILKIVWLLSE